VLGAPWKGYPLSESPRGGAAGSEPRHVVLRPLGVLHADRNLRASIEDRQSLSGIIHAGLHCGETPSAISDYGKGYHRHISKCMPVVVDVGAHTDAAVPLPAL
jgi:hypothetical protein